jgi:hypothetical protein
MGSVGWSSSRAIIQLGGESMMSGSTPHFEVPSDIRNVTEQSLDQVKSAIEGYLQFFQKNGPGNVAGGSELSNKVLGYSVKNVARAFDFARKLLQVRDVDELTRLQMDFMGAQMQAMTEQAKDLSETAAKVVMDSLKIPTKGGFSS